MWAWVARQHTVNVKLRGTKAVWQPVPEEFAIIPSSIPVCGAAILLHRWRRSDEYSSGESQLFAEFHRWCLHTEHVSRGRTSPQHSGLLLGASSPSSWVGFLQFPLTVHQPGWRQAGIQSVFFTQAHADVEESGILVPLKRHRSGTSSGHSGNFVISFPFRPSALISLFCPLSLHHTDICVPVVEISPRLSHSCIRRADTSQRICIYRLCVCVCVSAFFCCVWWNYICPPPY